MSGGYYGFKEHHIRDVMGMIKFDIEHNDILTEGFEGHQFGSDVIARMSELKNLLVKAHQLVSVADHLYSNDLSSDDFCAKYDSIIRGEYEYK